MNSDKQVLSVTEAARILGISRNLAYASVMRGEIPVLKIGRRLLVPRYALERMLREPEIVSSDRPSAR